MSIPGFLVPEQVVEKNGEGPALELGPDDGSLLELTLGILEVIEQQSLDVGIHISPDGAAWSPKPVLAFPQKFYPGSSKLFFAPARHPEARFLRAQWKVNRWGNWSAPPRFRFFVFAG